MSDYALVPAAGGAHEFHKPRPLLSLGEETIIERLIHQIRARGLRTIISVGSPGGAGWKKTHIRQFRTLPCEIIFSPYPRQKYSSGTILSLLKHLIRHYEIDDDTKIFIIQADYVFLDSLFDEFTQYRAPCVYEFKFTDPSCILTGGVLQPFMELLNPRISLISTLRDNTQYLCEELGFGVENHANEFRRRFVEVDWIFEYEYAVEMVARDGG